MSDCDEMRFLLQADVDGELTPAEAARVAVHLDACAACTALQRDLLVLSTRLRTAAPRYPASAALAASVRARLEHRTQKLQTFVSDPMLYLREKRATAYRLGESTQTADALAETASLRAAPAESRMSMVKRGVPRGRVPAFGGGFALAACLALLFLRSPVGDLSDAVVAAHIRALQPGHLMDVVSSDQHTVKPWFDGKLPFAPPVKDLKAVGFPLVGGRLDYLAGHTAAALVYRHGAHDINVFVWPEQGGGIDLPERASHNGYHYEHWTQDGMTFWAVTDLNARDLADFVERWRAS